VSPGTAIVPMHHAVARPVGVISVGLGLSMLLCAISAPMWTFLEGGDRPQDHGAAVGLVLSGVLTLIVGGVLWTLGRKASAVPLGRREAMLSVSAVWLLCGVFGGLPYVLDAGMSPPDALFEAISGFTTTGATTVADIEGTLSRPTLLWRALTQWLGGMGIVVLFVAIFPNIGVGARHLYRSEAPGLTVAPLQPRIAETGGFLWRAYLLITILAFGLYKFFGMSWFDATCHALTTAATGGFSTMDASLGAFDAARMGWWNSLGIEWTAVGIILLSGVNYAIFFAVVRTRSFRAAWRSTELRAYAGIVVLATLIVSIGAWSLEPSLQNAFPSFRQGLFNVATSITSTGYGVSGYRHLPTFALMILVALLLMGGCAGSTSGGIKVVRVVTMTKLLWAQLRQTFRPHVIQVVRMDGRPVDTSLLLDVAALFTVYILTLGLGIALVGAVDGVSSAKAFGAMVSALSNMGPAPFHEVGLTEIDLTATDTFHSYSAVSKLWFTVAMIVGRLEFFTLLALLLPDFWKR